MWTAVGFGLGIAVHITYCVAGLALIISKSILLFNIIKLLGAGYLMYIGLKSFFSKSSELHLEKQHKKSDISPYEAVKIGFLTNALNPKATVFFLSLFTLVINPNTTPSIMGILSMIMIVDTILWFSLVAIFFTQEKIRSTFSRYQNVFNKTFGGLLVVLGIKVALSEK